MAIPESEVERIDRRGALVQRLVDRDLDLRLGVVGEVDLVDRADRLAADQDLVAGHELAAGLEQELVVVAVVAAEAGRIADEHDRDDQRADARDPRHEPSRSSAIRLLSLHSGTAFALLLSTTGFLRRRGRHPAPRPGASPAIRTRGAS